MFRPVSSKPNFPKMEEAILRFWKEHNIFEKSVNARQGGPHFILYEGPPTTNGSPGIHHVLSRIYKDIIPRYKAMRGYYTPRKAGWDTHGLPVELEIEKVLGFTNKAQIEEYGISRFNAHCRESVFRYLKDWEEMTERIGFWLDMEHPYITLDNSYIESCWWAIKELWEKGLIYQGYKITPHCPRCGTSLSSHEVALGYGDAEDPSVYIKFKLDLSSGRPSTTALSLLASPIPTYFLAWTTTPWTLPGNTALAVFPEAEYALVEYETEGRKRERLILAQTLLDKVVKEDYTLKGVLEGRDIIGCVYEPLFNPEDYDVSVDQFQESDIAPGHIVLNTVFTPAASGRPQSGEAPKYFPVIGGDFVSLEEGTGIVHIAPAFGEVDFEIGEKERLYFVQPVNLEGKIMGSYPFTGKFVKEADPLILQILESKGLLYRREQIVHTYPFCWRCDSPLLYYAKRTWYIRTTAVKEKLISGNEEINWYPEHIKHGRFGDWLKNNVDWAFSRERYWGTPVPIWECEGCGYQKCIGSIEDLKALAHHEAMAKMGHTLDECLKDLHRPFVDNIILKCPESKPGESHYPDTMRRVSEVIDCWFDSGAMPFAQWHYPLENEKKFKESFPADYICEAIDQTRGWFYSLHALSTLLFGRPCFRNVICLGHVLDAKGEKMSKARGNVVDPWLILDRYGGDALRWYFFTSSPAGNVRRFSEEMVMEAMRNFLLTLWNTYSFFVIYANIDHFDPKKVATVALSDLDKWLNSELNNLILEVTKALDNYEPTSAGRRIAEFVDDLSNWYVRRSRRRFWKSENDADKMAAYTTLYHCLVTLSKLLAPFTPFIAEEIYQNLVRSIDPEAPESVHLTDFPVADRTQIDKSLMGDIRLVMKISSLGRTARSKAGIKVRQPLAKIIVKTRLEKEKEVLERLSSQLLDELNVKEVELTEREFDKPGYVAVTEGDYWVAVSTELSPELVAEGVAREIVRRLQTMRRQAGFDIADYIITYYRSEADIGRVIEKFADYIKQETLSRQLIEGIPEPGAYTETFNIKGSKLVLGVKRL